MSHRPGRRVALLAIVLSTSLGACGQTSSDDLAAAREAGRSQGAAQQKAEAEKQKLEREVAALKNQQDLITKKMDVAASAASVAAATVKPVEPAKVVSASHECGSGISVNSVTSCSFGNIVVQEWRGHGGGTISVDAWSPVTQRWYLMHCAAGMPTICRGGNNATVYIR